MASSKKRKAADAESFGPFKENQLVTAAAEFNRRVMKRLQKALARDPEVNLQEIFPSEYNSRLARKIQAARQSSEPPATQSVDVDESPLIRLEQSAVVVHELSEKTKHVFEAYKKDIDFNDGAMLASTLSRILSDVEYIWRSDTIRTYFVGKCSNDLIIKAIANNSDFTEYTSLQYLEHHKPELPVPRAQGLITCGDVAYLFQSYIVGSTLSTVWSRLEHSQKQALSAELNSFMLELRQLELPQSKPLGGTGGECCKDARRHVKRCPLAVYTNHDFWNFQYDNAPVGSPIYLTFLRRVTVAFQASRSVFTHGDLRPDNIIVQLRADGNYSISGIIDWEMGGFYPEDFECIKITNTLASNETSDWFLHLPSCVSPETYPSRWLADFAWDKQVV